MADAGHGGVITVRRVRTADELLSCLEIRREVFIRGQGVPENEEMDGRDDDCIHFLAVAETNGAARPAGTVRLRIVGGRLAKLERLAVHGWARRQGIGSALLRAVEAESRNRGHGEVVLGAQVSSIPFYERCGYAAEGDVFHDAGIPHRLMRRRLDD